MTDTVNILVIRNDKLGDFMLAWPALSLLKKKYPDSNITVLIPSYTKPIADICPWIDNVITDDSHSGVISDAIYLSKKLKQLEIDASISLYLEMRTSLALWLARIPLRYGPATKLAQLFLNKKLIQKRSSSLKPEYEYNNDLIRHYISSSGDELVEIQDPPYLKFDLTEIEKIRKAYTAAHDISSSKKLIFIHAGTGGSAINLSLQQFAKLAELISTSNDVHFVLTAGPDELETANKLSDLIGNIDHSVYHSTEGLVSFSKFINICDLFISGSTGPLHIAGALDVNTTAFYPARRSATPLRWQTINDASKRIYYAPEKYSGINDMQTIDIDMCAKEINQRLEQPARS